MNELALFAGAGGGILASHLLGWKTICAVEWEPYPASVLIQRQNDGILPRFPIWDDVQTFDGRPWKGIIDVISGGFPCQDISITGKGAGIDGKRSGMWFHMARIIGEVRPNFVFVENSPALITRGLGRVLGDLASLGYDCKWTMLGAIDVGAPHKRDRFWLVAHANNMRKIQSQGSQCDQRKWPNDSGSEMAYSDSAQFERGCISFGTSTKHPDIGGSSWWKLEPELGRVAYGVAGRVDRLKAIGNGQVPGVAKLAILDLFPSNFIDAAG